jgi:hypothetical protein
LSKFRAFHGEGEVINTPDGPCIFRDNGSSVLAVAHLDTVQRTRHFGLDPSDPDKLYCGQLDDRLGAHVILDMLPALGCNVDVLLTDGEESCRSTAAHFNPPKDYHWMVEFDRTGTDVVTYQYEDMDWLDSLEDAGNLVGWGSYSDIATLDHLGVCGVNWGVGFYDYHSPGAYCVLSELCESVKRFVEFYHAFHDTPFPYQEQYESWWDDGLAWDDEEVLGQKRDIGKIASWNEEWERYTRDA